jgi:hypothetical protein
VGMMENEQMKARLRRHEWRIMFVFSIIRTVVGLAIALWVRRMLIHQDGWVVWGAMIGSFAVVWYFLTNTFRLI